MREQPQLGDMDLFSLYAGDSADRWQELVGRQVKHASLGTGVITAVSRSGSGNVLFTIQFDGDSQASRKFTRQVLCDRHYFPELAMPADHEGIRAVRARLAAQQEAEKEQRLREAERAREEAPAQPAHGLDTAPQRSRRKESAAIGGVSPFVQGRMYRRRDLHEQFGGQRQGGISTPRGKDFILLFTGEAGEQHGYSDGWREGVFLYTGEGQVGDMEFVRGNAAIRDAMDTGKVLHLFAQVRKGQVRYLGPMICTGYHYVDGRDTDSRKRRMIRFELTPANRQESVPAGGV